MTGSDIENLAAIMRRQIYNAYRNTCIGDPPGIVRDAYERMKSPQVGDLVVEISTVWRREPNSSYMKGIGFLVSSGHEKVVYDDPDFVWDEAEEGRPHPTEQVFYIKTFDGQVIRWINAEIVAAQADLT